MKKVILGLFVFGSISAFAQNTNFNRNPISIVIEGDIYQNQVRIEKIFSQKLELIEAANTDQNLKCEKIRSHGVSVYALRSRCRNSLTGKKVATVFVDLHHENLEFKVKTARNQTINMPVDSEQ
jgi:hypothetical protein